MASRSALRLALPAGSPSAVKPTATSFAAVGRRSMGSSTPSSRRALPTPPSGRSAVFAALLGAGVVGLTAYSLGQDTTLWPTSTSPLLAAQLNLDAPAADPTILVDPSTSIPFPLSLSPLSTSSELALVGLGVRTVSFLRVKVYSAGFYVAPDAPGWGKEGMGGEVLMGQFLAGGEPCAMRIVPARNTDFAHLRDGLVRAVQGRLKSLTKAGQLSDEEAERASNSLNTFKTFFPSRSAPKGSELLLVKLSNGRGLAVEFDGQVLGTLEDAVVAREVFQSYFLDGGKEISPKLKESILAGFQSRPQ